MCELTSSLRVIRSHALVPGEEARVLEFEKKEKRLHRKTFRETQLFCILELGPLSKHRNAKTNYTIDHLWNFWTPYWICTNESKSRVIVASADYDDDDTVKINDDVCITNSA